MKQSDYLPNWGMRRGSAAALGGKAPTQAMQGFLREAGLLLEEALALHRRLDDAWGEGFALHTSAHVALLRGRLAEAQRLIDQSLARNNKLDDPRGLAFIRWEQAIIDAARHRPDRAEIELR